MPVAPTYPGVYIEEVPSGVRTITGVATSITAFLGRTIRGEANEPVTISSYADFERRFGGLNVRYPLTYAVRDFYLNGGSQAIIVRLFADAAQGAADAVADAVEAITTTPADAVTAANNTVNTFPANSAARTAAQAVATVVSNANQPGATLDALKTQARTAADATPAASFSTLTVGDLKLAASSPGTWGDKLKMKVDVQGIDGEVAGRYGLQAGDLFNLTVFEDPPNGPLERIINLSFKEGPRRIDRVLQQESFLIRFAGTPDTTKPAPPATPPANDPAINPANGPFFSGGANSDTLTPAHYQGSAAKKTGLFALDKADLFNLLCIPPDGRDADTHETVYQQAMRYCATRRAMLIVDPPFAWGAVKETAAATARAGLSTLGLTGTVARNAALYFPRVVQADPLRENQPDEFAPSGIIAGVMARTDRDRGVWKAPAGLDAALNGIQGLQVNLTDDENGLLNPLGINCLRAFPVTGRVVWGSRTLRGADQLADEYKYVPVRRLALFIEESLYRGTQWVVFEPNDEPLWAQIRLNVGAFMQTLFRQGAFQGTTPRDAYFVKCDKETTTQNDINLGIVNIIVGFAPLKPAEFVIIKLQQMAGQIQV